MSNRWQAPEGAPLNHPVWKESAGRFSETGVGGLKRCKLRFTAAMREILDGAEGRGLSKDERRELEVMQDRVRSLEVEILEAEDIARSLAGNGASGGDAYGGWEPEARALRPDESAASYVGRRGWGSGDEHADAAREAGPGRVLRALMMGPRDDLERRALAGGVDTSGGYTVPEVLSSVLIDRMRPQSHVLRAGARIVLLDSDRHTFAKVVTDPTPSWRTENLEVGETDMTFGAVTFAPRTLAFIVKAPRELLQDSVNLEEALPAVFSATMAQELDRVVLLGKDSEFEPLGIRNSEGVAEFAMGANGDFFSDYSPFVRIRRLILDANGPEPADVIMAPRTGESLANLKDGEGLPLRRPPVLDNWRFMETSKIPVDETQGSSTDASTAFVGNFNRVWIGQRLDLRVEVLRERYADKLQTGFLVWARWDVVLEQPAALGRIIGIRSA